MSETLKFLKKAPRVMSDNIRTNTFGETSNDHDAYHKAMGHTRKRQPRFSWANQGKELDKDNIQLRIGFDATQRPWYLKVPKINESENYMMDQESSKRQYIPLDLMSLQRAIDLERIDVSKPIDLNVLVNAAVIKVDMNGPLSRRTYGVNLVSQGMEAFQTPGIHLEVQMADDDAIAAIERAGSTVECAYYDLLSVQALMDPITYFMRARPIDKRQIPYLNLNIRQDASLDLYKYYYCDPRKRGYLADQEKVEEFRYATANDYGFTYNKATNYNIRKHPSQIFYNLFPGTLVNLPDRKIYQPKDQEILKYYKGDRFYTRKNQPTIEEYKPSNDKKPHMRKHRIKFSGPFKS